MPRYLLSDKAYINDRLYAAGEVVDTDLTPGPHMEPFVDDNGKEDKAARKAKDAALKTALPAPGDPSYIGKMIEHTMAGGDTNGAISTASGTPPLVPTQGPDTLATQPLEGPLGPVKQGD